MAEPRASTDEENAPLLNNDRETAQHDSFVKALFNPSRPLTFFEKVLGGLAVLLLLLASIFIGLFAGAEGTLKRERGKGGSVEWRTETQTATRTLTATHTQSGVTTTVSSVPTGKPGHKVCLTAECVTLSASIISSLNTSVDPCEYFYEFATGGWSASHSIPADKGLYGAFNEVADRNKKIISKVLESIPSTKSLKAPSAEEANLAKLKDVYDSCIDVDYLNEVGRKPLLPLVENILDIFGPFDLNPAPDDQYDLVEGTEEWEGTWDESYAVSDELLDAADRVDALKSNKKTARHSQPRSATQEQLDADVSASASSGFPEDRRRRITKTLAWLHSRGVDALVNFEIEGDAGGEDSQIQSLWLYQAFGGLPSKEYYEEKPILDLYQSVVSGILTDLAAHTSSLEKRDMMTDLISELSESAAESKWPFPWPGDGDKDGDDKPGHGSDRAPKKEEPLEERMERLAGKVVNFERELMRAGADPEYLFNPHYAYNPFPTEQVGKSLPFLDIPTYLSSYAPRSFPANITVTYPKYLRSVSKLVDETPDYILSGYFVTRLALSYASALGPKVTVRQETRRLQEVLRGLKKGTEEDRQDVCLGYVDEILGFIAGREFVREAFSPEAKADGEHIIRSIVKAFNDKLPHIPWMDKESAEAAQKKANAIIPKVGYPLWPNTTDPNSLASWYRLLEIKSDDFFGNVLRSTTLEEIRTWATLGRQRSRESWEMYPQTVNAYYSPPDGEIVFPAGILQPPFYSYKWPAHLRYGAFGAVAAHELTHAFDNSGSQYDDKGRLREWWTKKTVDAFEERAQCVAKQYSQYYVYDGEGKKVFVNGNLTNGEDIADSGLAQAYIAWKDSTQNLSNEEEEERLPGLDYSSDQLFFLAFARAWVQLTRPATAVSRVRTDPHSPPYWRATGTLRNLEAFHEAFKCERGSRMNPPKEEQCELW